MTSVFKLIGGALFGLAIAVPAQAQDPVKIGLVHGISGHAFEAFSKQAQTGFELGIEYATGGTNEIKGRPVELVIKDSQFKPDVARAVLAEAYGDDEVLLAVGADYNLLLVSRFKEEIGAGIKTGIIRSIGGTGSVVTLAGVVLVGWTIRPLSLEN